MANPPIDQRWIALRGRTTAPIHELRGLSGGVLVALDTAGTVYRRRWYTPWRVVLVAPLGTGDDGPSEEAIRLQVGARLTELVEEQPSDAFEDLDDQQAAERAEENLNQAVDDLQAERWLFGKEQTKPFAEGRIWTLPDGVVAVRRSDGLWISTDDGWHWTRGGFERTVPPVAPVVVRPKGKLRGTARGLEASTDGTVWSLRAAIPGGVRQLVAEPYGGSSVWIVGQHALFLTTDEGHTAQVVHHPLAAGVTSVVSLGPNHALATDGHQVVQTTDAGVTWHNTRSAPLARGRLWEHPDHEGVLTDGTVVYRLAAERQPDAGVMPEVSVESLVFRATHRSGMTVPAANPRLANLVPELQVQATIRPTSALDGSEGVGTSFDRGAAWQVQGWLTWRPGRGAQATELLIVDGQPIVLQGDVSGLVSARLGRTARRYQLQVAGQVIALVSDRRDVWHEGASIAAGQVYHRVMNELAKQEIDAMLDVLCDGGWRGDLQ